jgi:ubiquinone/menaquinone biosynthesis C-methylase UbiE
MKTIPEITDYYDNKLPYFMNDVKYQNPRHSRIKTTVSGIVKRDSKVLELGCGIGILSKFMAQLGAKVTAVDISPKLIEYAVTNMSHKNITYINQDVTTINYGEKYDIIVLADVFEHIRLGDIDKLMRVIKNHSQENTIVYLNIPDGRFQSFIKEKYPDKLQIVDESWSLLEILSQFTAISFTPAKIDMYGIDVAYQYLEIIFITDEKIARYYSE